MTKAKSGISITFLPQNKNVSLSHAECSPLESAIKAGIEISHSCGGHGTCGTCLVVVEEGLQSLPERNEIEKEMAEDRGFLASERLCCQLELTQNIVLRVPRKS